MTTTLVWAKGSHPCPQTYPSERAFEAHIRKMGYGFAKEQVRFNLELPRRGRTAKAVTPDYQILQAPDGRIYDRLFIELCEADRYTHRSSLSPAIRAKNRRHGASRQAFISPAEYLRRKRDRMQRAEGLYGVTIIVITYAQQQAIFASPALLDELITRRLGSAQPLRRIS